MMLDRTEAAYWLAFTFKLEGERKRERNGLVLTANRLLGLGILDLVRLDLGSLPEQLVRYRPTLERLQSADAHVSAMAFLVDELDEYGVELVPITHLSYPLHLARTLRPDTAPTLLSAVGDLRLLQSPGACVSGSRKAGREGLAFARRCGEALAGANITVVTGLAAGPDREALAGCMERGGRAIGVAPEGILVSRATRDPAVRAGRLCVISEFYPKQRWQAGLAMARNRTLAGLSRALFVADCVAQGGTTNQVEVHRGVGLPVYLRRGGGEGALVATLADWPGVSALAWDSGEVTLPVGVTSPAESGTSRGQTAASIGGSQAAGRVETVATELGALSRELDERRRTLAELDQQVAERRRELASLEERIRTVRLEGKDLSGSQEAGATPTLLMMVREPQGVAYAATSTVVALGPEESVINALRVAEAPLAIAELVRQLGLPEAKVRAMTRSLVEAGKVEPVKAGRVTKYVLPRALVLFPMRHADE